MGFRQLYCLYSRLIIVDYLKLNYFFTRHNAIADEYFFVYISERIIYM